MNDVNLKGCKFSAGVVPYMYGELRGADALAFESHLLECSDCTDEFAAISSVRYEVYDWKKLEFDPLETPVFAIPVAETEPSWIERFQAAFVRPWVMPGAALAGVALVSILGLSVLYSGDTGEGTIASVDSNNTTVVSPSSTSNVARTPEPEPAQRDVVSEPTNEVREPKATVVKASSAKTAQPKRVVRQVERIRQPIETRAVATPTKRAPRLNEFNDDEDKSLRLAQLFEDIDTRD